jgi:hypothetical protein
MEQEHQLNIYVPKALREPLRAAANKAGKTRAKWLLSLAEREIERDAKKGGKS